MNIKQWLRNKINEKAQRREQLSQDIINRNVDVENYVLNLLQELDDDAADTVNKSLLNVTEFRHLYVGSVEQRIKLLDGGANVTVTWNNDEKNPRVSGLLIKWSKERQDKTGCEAELFLDISLLLFK